MGDIVKSLQFLDFPECTKEALKFLATSLSSSSSGDGKYISDVCQDYVLFRRTRHRKPLNAIQELQLLELLCGFLEEVQDGVRTAAFAFIFGGRADPTKVTLLTKLLSMGISVQSKVVLDSVANWMQDHGCDSGPVLEVTRCLIQDYCRLFPDVTPAFQTLPSISPLLACNIMCVVTHLFSYVDKDHTPPPLLVDYVTQWISQNHSLCATAIVAFISPHMMMEGSERNCPVAGLLNWCVSGPLMEQARIKGNMNETASRLNGTASEGNIENNNILQVFSRLHLALLQTLLACRKEHCNLLSLKNMTGLVQSFQNTLRTLADSSIDEDLVQFSMDRLGQAVQVGWSTGNLQCSQGDLSMALKGLPSNRLLDVIIQKFDPESVTPMDVS